MSTRTHIADALTPLREQSGGDARAMHCAIPIDQSAPAIARKVLAEIGGTLSPGLLSHAQLLASELVSHRVRATPDARDGELELDISLTRSCLRVQLTDDECRVPRVRPDPGEPVLGWELQQVAELSDRWGMRHDTRTVLWWELDL
jgi:hypothetical protein